MATVNLEVFVMCFFVYITKIFILYQVYITVAPLVKIVVISLFVSVSGPCSKPQSLIYYLSCSAVTQTMQPCFH